MTGGSGIYHREYGCVGVVWECLSTFDLPTAWAFVFGSGGFLFLLSRLI